MQQYLTSIPPRFLQDCSECDVDTGPYDSRTRVWEPTTAQLDDVLDRARHYAGDSLDAAPPGLKVAARALLKAAKAAGRVEADYVNEYLAARPGRVRSEMVCKDGQRLSVQASEGHYCHPKDSVGPYSSVEVLADGMRSKHPTFGKPDRGYTAYRIWPWLSVTKVNAEIARRGGLA